MAWQSAGRIAERLWYLGNVIPLRAIGIAILASALFLGAPGCSQVQEKNVAQMRLQALRLLGSGTRIGDEGCDSFLKLGQVGESVARSLANKALDEDLMPTLKIAGDTCPNYMVKLIVSKAPELAAIRAILGREDSTEKDNLVLRGGDPFDPPLPKNPMEFTWYKYSTLHFGVMDGKVRVLRAYSKPPAGNEKQ